MELLMLSVIRTINMCKDSEPTLIQIMTLVKATYSKKVGFSTGNAMIKNPIPCIKLIVTI